MDAFGVVWENLTRYVVGPEPVSQVIAEVIDVCEAERAHAYAFKVCRVGSHGKRACTGLTASAARYP